MDPTNRSEGKPKGTSPSYTTPKVQKIDLQRGKIVKVSAPMLEQALKIKDCVARFFAVVGVVLSYAFIIPAIIDAALWGQKVATAEGIIPPIIQQGGAKLPLAVELVVESALEDTTLSSSRGAVKLEQGSDAVAPAPEVARQVSPRIEKPSEVTGPAVSSKLEVTELGRTKESEEKIQAMLGQWAKRAESQYYQAHEDFIKEHAEVYPVPNGGFRQLIIPDYNAAFVHNQAQSNTQLFPRYVKYMRPDGPLYAPTKDRRINEETDRFMEIKSMADHILNVINETKGIEVVGFNKFIECKSGEKVQAVACFDSNTREIAYIVTNPDNNNHILNKDCRVRGAGSAIIKHIAKQGGPVILDAVPQAVSFYKRIGFVQDITRTAREDGEVPMSLTAAKVQRVALGVKGEQA